MAFINSTISDGFVDAKARVRPLREAAQNGAASMAKSTTTFSKFAVSQRATGLTETIKGANSITAGGGDRGVNDRSRMPDLTSHNHLMAQPQAGRFTIQRGTST